MVAQIESLCACSCLYKVYNPLNFYFYFVVLQSGIEIDLIVFFLSLIYTKYKFLQIK